MGAGAAGEGRRWRLDAQGEVDFVVQRDAVVAGPRDLRLLQPGTVDRARPQLGQPEPAALVEPERVDVVVGGGEPDLAAAEAPRCARRGLDEHGPDADPALDGVERDDLQYLPLHLVGEQADDPPGPFGDEPGQFGGPQHAAVHGDEFGTPQLGDEPGEHRAVAVADRPDGDLRLAHDANYEAMIQSRLANADRGRAERARLRFLVLLCCGQASAARTAAGRGVARDGEEAALSAVSGVRAPET